MFVGFIVLGVIALIIFVIAFFLPKEDKDGDNVRKWVRFISAGFALVAALLFVLGSFVSIGTKNLGVVTTFGKPTGHLSNGLHLKAPWQKVHELSDAVQTDTYASDGGSDKPQGGATDSCINVRIGRQATACVNVSIRWQIREDGVDYLFRNYKDNGAITDNLVLRDLQQAMNEQLGQYDPLGIDTNGQSTNKPLSSATDQDNFSTLVQKQMQTEIGQYITVQSVLIPIMNFDTKTQTNVNNLLAQYAATRTQTAALGTAEATARVNKELAQSLANDPNVLVSRCLDIEAEAVAKGVANLLPDGGGCFGNSSLSIGGGK